MTEQERINLTEDLTLMLLYLNAWTEQHSDVLKSWKGFAFATLDALSDRDLIIRTKNAQSVVVTEEGAKEAQTLLAKYGLVGAGAEE